MEVSEEQSIDNELLDLEFNGPEHLVEFEKDQKYRCINHVSEGGLVNPTEIIKEVMSQCDKIFKNIKG